MTSKALSLAKIIGVDKKISEQSLSAQIVLGPEEYNSPSELPFVGNQVGDQAFVLSNNRLYIWSGAGWYSVALINTSPSFDSSGLPLEQYLLDSDNPSALITLLATDPEGVPITYSATTDSGSDFVTILQGSGDSSNVFTVNIKSLDSIVNSGYDSGVEAVFDVTFKASDGINLATALSEFTVRFSVKSQYWDETALSIGTNSTNGIANSTFIDRSTNAHTVTPTGSPLQTAFHPYLDNWSVDFPDGSSRYLTVPSSNDFDFGTGDFTIEMWINFTDVTSTWEAIISRAYGVSGGWRLYKNQNNNQLTWYSNTTSLILTTGSTLTNNDWSHIAVVRNSGELTIYIDGFNRGSIASDTSNYNPGNYALEIGEGVVTSAYPFGGYISNLRVVKGTALYTTNFTPPTEKLTAVSGTSLLTCQSNRFIDESSSAHSITVNGDPKISAFNPFGQDSEYAVGENKGSGYFSTSGSTSATAGTGQYIQSELTSTLTLDTNDFTVECWVYGIEKIRNYPRVIQIGPQNSTWGASQFAILYKHDDDNDSITVAMNGIGGNALLMASGPINDGEWNHVAVTRSGTTFTLYINGESVDTYTSSGSATGTGDKALLVGSASAGNSDFYGYVSDVKIYNGTVVYSANFTPPTAPVGNTNASLYLPMDNAGIFDKTGNNTLTPVGNASTSTTQTKFADTAMYFDGSGDSVIIPNSSVFNFSNNGPFTLEFWMYPLSLTGSPTISFVSKWIGGSGQPQSWLCYYESGQIRFLTSNFVYPGYTYSTLNQWVHIAVTSDGTNLRLFTDGILRDTVTGYTITEYDKDVEIGNNIRLGVQQPFNGYIENLQILKGVAKYTTNFTAPNREQGIKYQAEL